MRSQIKAAYHSTIPESQDRSVRSDGWEANDAVLPPCDGDGWDSNVFTQSAESTAVEPRSYFIKLLLFPIFIIYFLTYLVL